jgi:conjugative relaxase-like TrwC/TraI family protein
VNYCLALARATYFLTFGEPLGRWIGKGLAALGLSGTVEADDLRKLCGGYAPRSGVPLVQNAGRPHRILGWDSTFSAPKSVSVLWATSSPAVQEKIQELQQQASEKALAYLGECAAVTRRGKGGIIHEKCSLATATFEHGTSRTQDPHLHTHVIIANAGLRADGSWSAMHSIELYRHKMAAGAVYRAELAAGLQRELGLEIVPDGFSFRIKGIDDSVCEAFSKRRHDVVAAMKERGVSSQRAAEIATLDTRQPKEHVARSVLFKRWQAEARELGWTVERATALLGRYHPDPSPRQTLKAVVSDTLADILQRNSFFSESELVCALTKRACGLGLTADQLLAAAREILCRREIRDLGLWDGARRFTTQEVIYRERALIAAVTSGRKNAAHVIQSKLVEKIISDAEKAAIKEGKGLSQEQKDAIRWITARPGRIQVLDGIAGSGKSTILGIARQAWEENGYKVVGAALAGIAAQRLEEGSGIRSFTVAKLLHELDKKWLSFEVRHFTPFPEKAPSQTIRYLAPTTNIRLPKIRLPKFGKPDPNRVQLDRKTILVIDEAAMLDTRTMKALVEAVNRADAKLVMAGDARQLQPIGAGAPFNDIAKALGAATLMEIKRQSDDQAKKMVKDFSEGKAAEALRVADEKGHVHQGPNKQHVINQLVGDWAPGGVAKPKDNLILAGTNEDVAYLNQRAQAVRKRTGKLSGLGRKINGQKIYKGDRVLFGQNASYLGINNGTIASVTKVRGKALDVRLDSGKRVSVPLQYYPKDQISLGYALTTHKAQGASFENTFVLIDPTMQDRELTYVQASRARSTTRFYVDEETAGESLGNVIKKMEKSHQKSMATTLSQDQEGQSETAQSQQQESERRRQEQERLRQEEERRRQQKPQQSQSL